MEELRRPCIGYNERCPECEAKGTEGRILFEPAVQESPHLSSFIFERWGATIAFISLVVQVMGFWSRKAFQERGDPIYPALMPGERVQRGGADKPWHMLTNADNFHALQLLLYAYEGKVDVIYIDPHYNTGARDWKYNNDYVDKADSWRHSKWLSMLKKRLLLANDF